MKPVLQVFALVLEELPGFKGKLGKQRRLQKELLEFKKKLAPDKYKEKEEKIKNREVKLLLFDKYLRLCKKDNSTSVKDLFAMYI